MNIAELSRDNPRLIELEAAYADLHLFEHSLWKTWADNIDIQKFRGENAYISTWYGMTEEKYHNTYQYLCEIGEGETLARLGEDGAFGAVTLVAADGVTFSRDLLDSVCELRFLRETLGLSANSHSVISLLDVGAGYGRLLHRWFQWSSSTWGWGVDGVPLSTFLCDYYLDYRMGETVIEMGMRRALSMPLSNLAPIHNVDIASNCYSFSEMPLSAVRFWLGFCADLNIPHFFLVPHAGDLVHPHFVTSEPDGSHLNYYAEFERHGYREVRREWKFPEAESARYIYNTQYIMFSR